MRKLLFGESSMKKQSARRRRGSKAICESLEDRQMLSLTISLQEAGGATSATVTSVGQVITLNVIATITGADGDPTIDALQDVDGRFESTAVDGHAVAGNLTAANVSPFNANGAAPGTFQDLNGDGNTDVGGTGGTDGQSLDGDFFARSASRELLSPDGTESSDGHSLIFTIGTLSYTVTNLNEGGRTDINFVVPTSTTNIAASWFEDGPAVNNFTATFQAGTPFVVQDAALVVPPTAVNDSATVYRNVAKDINELANDNFVRTLNPSSVTVVTNTAHGTTSVQPDGSILYTPTNNYVGTDSFTYKVADTDGTYSNVATVDITVTAPPPPVAVADTATTLRDTATTVDVLANDTTSVGTLVTSSVAVVAQPAHGTAVKQSDGTIIYTPTSGYVGTDTFTYTVADSVGDTSAAGTVTVTVNRPALPVAGAVSATTVRNLATTVDVLSADTTTVGTIVNNSILVVATPTNGTAVAQSDGTILYTPTTGFTGSDSFTYTVADSDGDVSNPGTVTVTVNTPVPPVAVGDTYSDTAGTPDSLSVLSNDTSTSAALANGSIVIVTNPAHGTAVPKSDGTVLYTPTAAYLGTDSFTYTVADAAGDVSNVATVSLTMTAAPLPVGASATAPVLAGQTGTINVATGSTSVATVIPGSVAVVTQGTEGTASSNGDGTISYTAKAGFVGTDQFTYTIGDTNGNTSVPATVTVDIGTPISGAKGAAHSLTFTDAAQGLQTIKLNVGTAAVFFTGNGTVTIAKSGAATIAGSNLNIGSIILSDTTAGSSLSVKGSTANPVTINGITDSSPLGSILAPSATMGGTLSLNSLTTLQTAALNSAAITMTSTAGHLALTAGSIVGTGLTTAAPITSIKTSSWESGGSITAPSIGTLTVSGPFNADITLSAGGAIPALKTAKITGAVSGGTWTLAGSLGNVTVGSLGSSWVGAISGGITTLTIKSGGLASDLTASSIGTLLVTGDLTTGITAQSAKLIHITGAVTGSNIDFTGAAGVKQLIVGGAISGATISSIGSLGTITALSLTDTTITADVASTVTIANATANTLGSGSITGIKLTGKTGSDDFTNSDILAAKIGSASLGTVNTDNGSAYEGIAVKTISSVSGTFSGQAVTFAGGQLRSEAILQQYALQRGVVFGDFQIAIET